MIYILKHVYVFKFFLVAGAQPRIWKWKKFGTFFDDVFTEMQFWSCHRNDDIAVFLIIILQAHKSTKSRNFGSPFAMALKN